MSVATALARARLLSTSTISRARARSTMAIAVAAPTVPTPMMPTFMASPPPLPPFGGGERAGMRRIARLDLQGGMADAVMMVELAAGLGQQLVVEAGARPHQVGGQRHLGGAHRPDVQVVHFRDAGQRQQVVVDPLAVDVGRYGVEREVDRVLEQRPGAGDD